MKHSWRGVQLKPNDVNGPAEYDEECQNCGMLGKTDDNEFSDCPEVAWLIQQCDDHGPSWLTGPAPGYQQGTFPFVFSYDVNDAIRFSRERDAAELAAYLGDNYLATEHIWQ